MLIWDIIYRHDPHIRIRHKGEDILSDLLCLRHKAFKHCHSQPTACKTGLYRHHSAHAACAKEQNAAVKLSSA